MRHVIVGIDAGKTAAIACITLDGKLLRAAHKTFGGYDWMVSEIREAGIPSVVSTDKARPNSLVRRINAAFNSRMSLPERDLQSEEKRQIAKAANLKNRHEQDAYAAAVKAYYKYANKLNQANRSIAGMDSELQDRIMAKIIKKHSISEAISNKTANRR